MVVTSRLICLHARIKLQNVMFFFLSTQIKRKLGHNFEVNDICHAAVRSLVYTSVHVLIMMP